jgi:radical SAM protein with 4Fe4S-binding SPASM domain
MINLTKLLIESAYEGDYLRYSPHNGKRTAGAAAGLGPVVVWNATRACNLKCVHCYADATPGSMPHELSTPEAKAMIRGLSQAKVPVLFFSGGEPLARRDIFELAQFAATLGIRPVVSTNGTLITPDIARSLKDAGVKYVGISLDGIGAKNDQFRGVAGAFSSAWDGIRNCLAIGQKVGLRFTISQHNYQDIPRILDLVAEERIARVCFYHLVYTGRGNNLLDAALSRAETREVLDLLITRTLKFHQEGFPVEILTVDNHADGIYTYLWLQAHDRERAERALRLLRHNGGNRSGIALACVDWQGDVHPDQFLRHITLGNVRESEFGTIWSDLSHPVLAGLRNRKPLLQGRCSKCRWLDLCNGNFRARALTAGGLWDSDPACYLSDQEIEAPDSTNYVNEEF